MATVIKIKTGTATPTTSDITDREVAIDKTAQKFYINDGGTIKEIAGAAAQGNAFANIAVSGQDTVEALNFNRRYKRYFDYWHISWY